MSSLGTDLSISTHKLAKINVANAQASSSQMDSSSYDSGNSLSAEDLLYLMNKRFLDLLIVDLQTSTVTQASASNPNHESLLETSSNQPQPSTASSQKLKLLGSYQLPKLARDLAGSPNLGSAVYTIICSDALRQLISALGCPFLVVYDEDGEENHCARKFVDMMNEVVKVTGMKRFNGLRWVRYLRGGLAQFQKLAPTLCVAPSPLWTEPEQSEKTILQALCIPQGARVSKGEDVDDDPPCLIHEDFLYLGGMETTRLDHIKRHDIQHVISIGETPKFISDEHVLVEPMEVTFPTPVRRNRTLVGVVNKVTIPSEQNTTKTVFHYSFDLEDVSHAPIQTVFGQTNHILHQAFLSKQGVLVHCFGGVSRSSTIIIAYLVSVRGLTLAEAFAKVFRSRPWIKPNDGFWKRLQELEVKEQVNILRARVQDDPHYQKAVLRKSASSPTGTTSSTLSSPYHVLSASPSSPAKRAFDFATPAKARARSRLITELEDEANATDEGTLTNKVMRNARLDRVENFWLLKNICKQNGYI